MRLLYSLMMRLWYSIKNYYVNKNFLKNQFTFTISEKLDPTHTIFAGRFARESMVYEGNQYVKDLRYMNRDPRRMVVIEKNPSALKYHLENGIFIPEFKGEKDDK